MAKKPNQVEITEFSKKSLEQLKKTFAPSMESLFEARNKVNDGLGGLDSGGKGSKFGLGKLLKRVGKFSCCVRNIINWCFSWIYYKIKRNV